MATEPSMPARTLTEHLLVLSGHTRSALRAKHRTNGAGNSDGGQTSMWDSSASRLPGNIIPNVYVCICGRGQLGGKSRLYGVVRGRFVGRLMVISWPCADHVGFWPTPQRFFVNSVGDDAAISTHASI